MDKLGFTVFVTCFSCALATININEIKGPDSIKSGSTDEVVLDCDFSSKNDSEVVIKWFYNGLQQQIYQWIPGTGHRPTALGPLHHNNIDLEYQVTNDEKTMYRALRILNLKPEMSGNYTCKVSSFEDEDMATKQLIIYTPAQNGLDLALFEDDCVVSCTANGVYPKPDMDIYVLGNETNFKITEDENVDERGFYNITKTLTFDRFNIENPTTFFCNLSIPGTNYVLARNIEHYIDNSAFSNLPFFYSFLMGLLSLHILR